MQCLGLLVLLVAAASAYPTDKFFYRCFHSLSDHSVVFPEQRRHFLCDAIDGRRYLVEADNSFIDDSGVIRFTRTIPFLGGLGGSAAQSASQASAGSLSGGIGGGLLPFQLSGSVSGAQSSAASGAGAGNVGFLG